MINTEWVIYVGGNNLVISAYLVIVFLNDIISDFSVCIANLTWVIVFFFTIVVKVLLAQICSKKNETKKPKSVREI